MFIKPFNDRSGKVNSNLFADYGTFIYGLFGTFLAVVNSILIYITFVTQRNQFHKTESRYKLELEKKEQDGVNEKKRQDDFFQTERFESRFFEMVKTNRQMVWQMEYEVPDEFTPVLTNGDLSKSNKHNIILVRGQKVFVQIHKHINQARKECNWIYQECNGLSDLFKDKSCENKEKEILQKYFEKNVADKLVMEINWYSIIYLCIFFGLDKEGQKILNKLLKVKYNNQLVDRVIHTLKLKPVKWSNYWDRYCSIKANEFSSIKENRSYHLGKDDYTKYYGGHQHRLGHYFRNLFAIFNFLNQANFIRYKDKYSYAKFLRSQFSTYEQSLFFYNSLSPLGRVWEIEAEKNEENENLIDKRLITKYNLIKNIPSEYVSDDLDLSEFYPNVEYELGKKILKKEQLKNQYK